MNLDHRIQSLPSKKKSSASAIIPVEPFRGDPSGVTAEELEERAAIMEFDGGLPREEAERRARAEVRAAELVRLSQSSLSPGSQEKSNNGSPRPLRTIGQSVLSKKGISK
jgi:hypothetical protein